MSKGNQYYWQFLRGSCLDSNKNMEIKETELGPSRNRKPQHEVPFPSDVSSLRLTVLTHLHYGDFPDSKTTSIWNKLLE